MTCQKIEDRHSSATQRFDLQRTVVLEVLNGGALADVGIRHGLAPYQVKGMVQDGLRRVGITSTLKRGQLREQKGVIIPLIEQTATLPGAPLNGPILSLPLHTLQIPTGNLVHLRYAGIQTVGDFVLRDKVEIIAIRHMTAKAYEFVVGVIRDVLQTSDAHRADGLDDDHHQLSLASDADKVRTRLNLIMANIA